LFVELTIALPVAELHDFGQEFADAGYLFGEEEYIVRLEMRSEEKVSDWGPE